MTMGLHPTDQLPWRPGSASRLVRHRIALHGVTAEVVAPSQPFLYPLGVALGGYLAAASDVVPDVRITIDPADGVDRWRVASTAEPRARVVAGAAEAARRAEWLFANEALRRLKRYIHVHAAALASEERSAVLVGRSGVGKSTTSVGLACAGLTLYADDVTLIDPNTLRPVSFCRPIKLDRGSRRMLRRMGLRIPASRRLRESVARAALPGIPSPDLPAPPVEFVLFFAGERDTTPHLRPLTSAEGILRIVRQSVSESIDSNGVTAGGLSLINGARCYELTAGGLEDTVRVVVDLMRNRSVSDEKP